MSQSNTVVKSEDRKLRDYTDGFIKAVLIAAGGVPPNELGDSEDFMEGWKDGQDALYRAINEKKRRLSE